jgi:hypothetical protein
MMTTTAYTIMTAGGRRLPLAAARVSDATVAAMAVARATKNAVQLIDDTGRSYTVTADGITVRTSSLDDDGLAA